MAGHPPGVPAPSVLILPAATRGGLAANAAQLEAHVATGAKPSADRPLLRLVPCSTRTRRNHGVCLVGEQLATVYSARRRLSSHGVQLVLGPGDGAEHSMSPAQARSLARALEAAAAAAERQQQPGGAR